MNNNLRFYYDNAWRWKCGLPENEPKNTYRFNIKDLKKSEWSKKFESLMRNRLIMGAFRYGKLGSKKPNYDYTKSIEKRLDKYKETGNKEYLVDIANYSMLEFVDGVNPNAYFKSIDDGEHTTIKPK